MVYDYKEIQFLYLTMYLGNRFRRNCKHGSEFVKSKSEYTDYLLILFGMGGGGRFSLWFFLCCIRAVCSTKMKFSELLLSKYGASENQIFVHLGLNSLPWQGVSCLLSENYKKVNISVISSFNSKYHFRFEIST